MGYGFAGETGQCARMSGFVRGHFLEFEHPDGLAWIGRQILHRLEQGCLVGGRLIETRWEVRLMGQKGFMLGRKINFTQSSLLLTPRSVNDASVGIGHKLGSKWTTGIVAVTDRANRQQGVLRGILDMAELVDATRRSTSCARHESVSTATARRSLRPPSPGGAAMAGRLNDLTSFSRGVRRWRIENLWFSLQKSALSPLRVKRMSECL